MVVRQLRPEAGHLAVAVVDPIRECDLQPQTIPVLPASLMPLSSNSSAGRMTCFVQKVRHSLHCRCGNVRGNVQSSWKLVEVGFDRDSHQIDFSSQLQGV